MTINLAAGVVAALVVDLGLHIKVGDAHDAVSVELRRDGVDDGVELGDHGQRVGHGDQVGLDIVLGGGARRLVVVGEAEMASISTDDRAVLPSQALEAFPGDLAQGRRKIDEVYRIKGVGDVDELIHLLDVVAGTTTDLEATR